MIDPVAHYFGAERAGALLLLAIGLVAMEASMTFWRKSRLPQAKGAAATLALVAALQLSVGTIVFVRSPADQQRVSLAIQHNRLHIERHEIPRMQQVMHHFELYRGIEIGVLVVGLLLAVFARRGSFARGAGMGLVPQSVAMLGLDALAEQRGAAYLAWLQTL
ncbi:hypothetical protein [Ideonella sp. A 288]|uniref:hypothetical protein n=1 Tax=Ideonella sp. A 288 TaxID=1962181 RepID=UPI000B4C1F6E|nr:hypothetical protein [Ideonella sp. A 288]